MAKSDIWMVVMDAKKIYIHTFQDGNQCHLTIEQSGPGIKCGAVWKQAPDWNSIRNDYLIWSDACADDFIDNVMFA